MRNLIRHILKETTEDLLKKYWVNKWDKEKSKGDLPRFNYDLIKKLGLKGKWEKILDDYIEYMGGPEEIKNIYTNFLSSKEFTTEDINDKGIATGGYDFSFRIINPRVTQTTMLGNGEPELYFDLLITDGYVTLMTTGEKIDLTDIESIDEHLWWELSNEIKDMISDFTKEISGTFGNQLWDVIVDWA